jgi:hypothetical protein
MTGLMDLGEEIRKVIGFACTCGHGFEDHSLFCCQLVCAKFGQGEKIYRATARRFPYGQHFGEER